MPDSDAITLPSEWAPVFEYVLVEAIDIPDDRLRAADLDVDDLAESIERNGLLACIHVRRSGERFTLIAGYRRLESYRQNLERLGAVIAAMVYPEGLPAEWARIIEIDENARRQELTADEREDHLVRLVNLVAAIKSLQGAQTLPDGVAPATGRGHKGVIQMAAEQAGVDQATIRRAAEKMADTIDEPVDLAKDSPEELTRKAEKFKKTPKPSYWEQRERRAERRQARKLEKELEEEDTVRSNLRQVLTDHGLSAEDVCALAEFWGWHGVTVKAITEFLNGAREPKTLWRPFDDRRRRYGIGALIERGKADGWDLAAQKAQKAQADQEWQDKGNMSWLCEYWNKASEKVRREFLAWTGYAIAVAPVAAGAIADTANGADSPATESATLNAIVCTHPGCETVRPPTRGRQPKGWLCDEHRRTASERDATSEASGGRERRCRCS